MGFHAAQVLVALPPGLKWRVRLVSSIAHLRGPSLTRIKRRRLGQTRVKTVRSSGGLLSGPDTCIRFTSQYHRLKITLRGLLWLSNG